MSPLIQSDSQIKLYQTIEYKKSGLNSHRCFELENKIDTQFEFYPFRYPWAYFNLGDNGEVSCVFQYPSFFSQFFSILPITYNYFNLIILLLYILLCFILMLGFRIVFQLNKLEYILLGGIFFLVGFGITSAFEFSESVPAHIFLSLLFFSIFAIEMGQKVHFLLLMTFGFLGAISIFLRSESIMYIGITGFVLCYYHRNEFLLFVRRYIPFVIGALLSIILFASYNYSEFGEIFGVRSKISLIDFTRLSISERIHLISEFFLGNENRVGFLSYCFPSIVLIIYSYFKGNLNSFQKKYINIMVLSFLCIVILSPYSSGGLYAGMRFTEFTYLLMTVYVVITYLNAQDKVFKRICFSFIILQIGFGVFHVRKNIKNLDYIKKYHEIYQTKLDQYPDSPVLHLSTFDLLLISDSFLKKPHWIVNHQKKFDKLEEKLIENSVSSFQVFVYDFTPPKDDNVTMDFYKEWIDTKYEIKSKYFQKQSDEKIAGFRLMLWKKK
ncbi:hypothetical protein AB3N60_09895 [Leptospira sp. WS39.C2]